MEAMAAEEQAPHWQDDWDGWPAHDEEEETEVVWDSDSSDASLGSEESDRNTSPAPQVGPEESHTHIPIRPCAWGHTDGEGQDNSCYIDCWLEVSRHLGWYVAVPGFNIVDFFR